MLYEKIFVTEELKHVKISLKGYYSEHYTKIELYVEVLIKEAMETDFHKLGRLNLRRYSRFEMADKNRIRDQVVTMSGITDQQLNQVISEFAEISESSVL